MFLDDKQNMTDTFILSTTGEDALFQDSASCISKFFQVIRACKDDSCLGDEDDLITNHLVIRKSLFGTTNICVFHITDCLVMWKSIISLICKSRQRHFNTQKGVWTYKIICLDLHPIQTCENRSNWNLVNSFFKLWYVVVTARTALGSTMETYFDGKLGRSEWWKSGRYFGRFKPGE